MSSREHESPSPQPVVPFQGLSADERIMHLEGAFEMLDAAPAVKQVSLLSNFQAASKIVDQVMTDVRDGIVNQRKKFGEERRELQELQAFVSKHLGPSKPGGKLIEENIRKNQLREQQMRKKELVSRNNLQESKLRMLD